jgi:uncharacterized protein
MIKFEWDKNKDAENIKKHKVSFELAKLAFFDSNSVIFTDVKHSTSSEKRYYCFGKVDEGILTVRFAYRNDVIRIFGAGYWREGKKTYEKENK